MLRRAEGSFASWVGRGGVGAMLVLQLLFIYAPPMQMLFQTEALSLASWVNILAVALITFLIVEFEKKIYASRVEV